jgi:hypothetical protein
MPTRYRDDEEDEGGEAPLHDWEDPDESDADDEEDDDDPETVPCPYCGKQVSELAELCPYCKSFISREDAPGRKPVWLIVGVGACLVVVVLVWIL